LNQGDHVFLNAFQAREFVGRSLDANGGHRRSFQGREQNPTQRMSHGVAIAFFKRLGDKLSVGFCGSGIGLQLLWQHQSKAGHEVNSSLKGRRMGYLLKSSTMNCSFTGYDISARLGHVFMVPARVTPSKLMVSTDPLTAPSDAGIPLEPRRETALRGGLERALDEQVPFLRFGQRHHIPGFTW
jgi:hypothetical protein